MGTFVVDGEGLVLVEDLVAADVAVLGRTVGVAGVDLQDLLVGRPALVGVGHVRRLAELGRVLVDVVDADVHRRAAENQSRNKKEKRKTRPLPFPFPPFRRRPIDGGRCSSSPSAIKGGRGFFPPDNRRLIIDTQSIVISPVELKFDEFKANVIP